MKKLYIPAFLILCIIFGCGQNKGDNSAASFSVARDSITQLMNNTVRDVTAKGPIGWLSKFENSPEFYMANNGAIALKDYHSAEKFIKDTLSKSLQHINLKFSNVRIIVLSPESGSIGAEYYETLGFTKDAAVSVTGYFTATARNSAAGWRFTNLHWSSKNLPVN